MPRLLRADSRSGRALIWVGSVTALGGAVVATRGTLAAAAAELERFDPLQVAGAACLTTLVPLATAAAWRTALLSTQPRPVSFRRAWRCYGFGALANAALPGRIGDAARIELFAREIEAPRPRLTSLSASASVALAQAVVLGGVLLGGTATGALPPWTALPAVCLPLAVWAARSVAVRRRPDGAAARALRAAKLSPRATCRVVGWVALGGIARLGALTLLLQALGAPHPVAAAVVAVAARAAGGALPIAPGAVGLPAAAMALGLAHVGVNGGIAVAVAVSFHALESVTALAFGACGLLFQRGRPGADSFEAGSVVALDGVPAAGVA